MTKAKRLPSERASIIKGAVLYISIFFAAIVGMDQLDKFLYGYYADKLIKQIGGLECRFPEAKPEEQKYRFFSASL